jgi:hypothetical protein
MGIAATPAQPEPRSAPEGAATGAVPAAAGAVPITTSAQPVNSAPTTANSFDTLTTRHAGSRSFPAKADQSTTAIVKVEAKVGSTLPVFSVPPIDVVVLSNLNDKDLLSVAKQACSFHTQAGAYAKEFLAELKRRFNEGKKLRKPYLGFKNFDKLCADRLEIGERQVRNILNNDRGGRKGRALKPRPKLKELENVKAENKRLKAHAKLVEDANATVSQGAKNSCRPAIPRRILSKQRKMQ